MAKIEHDEGESYSRSLREKVFYQIQNDILNGVYQPGDSLTEKKLCDELGVSRTPVREAIRQLELRRTCSLDPQQGCDCDRNIRERY